MMHNKFNSDSKAIEAAAPRLHGANLSEWDQTAMTKAIWALADCQVLRLFAVAPSPDLRRYH
jgi:hypothetical protein